MSDEKTLPSDEELKEESETEESEGETSEDETSEDEKSEEEKSEEETEDESEDEETVVLKKSEHDKLVKERDNYRKGFLSIKRKGKEKRTGQEGDFVTRKEFFRSNEKSAIHRATTPNKDDSERMKTIKREVNENWEDISSYFNPSTSRDTVAEIEEGIYDAHAAWRRRTPSKKSDENKGAKANLSHDAGTGGSSPETESPKKSILGKSESVDDWYKKK